MRLMHAVAFSKKLHWLAQNQCNYFENATACSKRTLKTTVATQLYLMGANLLFFAILENKLF